MRLLSGLLLSVVLCPFVWAAPVDSACHIKVVDKVTMEWNAGSGTVIACENGKSLILSCTHVVPDDKGTITIWIKDKKYEAKFLAASKQIEEVGPTGQKFLTIDGPDLSLIVIDVALPVVEIATANPKLGDKVRQWGFAGGKTDNGPFYKEGKITKTDELWSTSDARRGDSGCGLFNDKDELVGVVHSRSIDEDVPGGLAVPVEDVRKWLKGKVKDFPELKKKIGDK